MADRVSASIVIGGLLSASEYAELAALISDESLSTEWDGEAFAPEHCVAGRPLSLYAHEVAWGRFGELESWCVERLVPFARWSGGYSGQWGPERVVHQGDGTLTSYATTEDDIVVIPQEVLETLGSFEATLAHFAAADFTVPPLVVEGDLPQFGISTESTLDAEGPPHVE